MAVLTSLQLAAHAKSAYFHSAARSIPDSPFVLQVVNKLGDIFDAADGH